MSAWLVAWSMQILTGRLIGIPGITIGLDYLIYLSDGNIITVNAEESPGKIEKSKNVKKNYTASSVKLKKFTQHIL